MAPHIYPSNLPDVEIPECSVFDFCLNSKYNDRDPNSPAYIDGLTNEVLTRTQFKQHALTLAASLEDKFAFKKGEVVMLLSPNSIHYPVVEFATIAAGGAVTFANPTYTGPEIVHQIQDSRAKIIFVHPEALPALLNAAAILKWSAAQTKARIVLATHTQCLPKTLVKEGWTRFDDLVYAKGLRAREKPVSFDGKAARTETVFLYYSSGTTGKSKGVMTTHYNLVSQLRMTVYNWGDITAGKDVMLAVIPWYHVTGGVVTLLYPLARGVAVTVLPRFEPNSFLTCIGTHRVTALIVAPPLLLFFVKTPLLSKYDISSLRTILSGSAPASNALVQGAVDRLNAHGTKDVTIGQAYGLTETSPGTHLMPPQWARTKLGSIGQLMPNMKARLVDEDGNDAPIGGPGELWMSGPNVMKGYLNNPKATAETVTSDGWLKSGDIAVVDKDGFWKIVDRKKELIKYKGYQVPPAELEALLLSNEEIADAGVIGIYSEKDEAELPRAYVVPRDPKILSGPDVGRKQFAIKIQQWVKSKVVHYKQLRGGVILMDAIPRSAAGKILRKELRVIANKENATTNAAVATTQARL